MAHTHPDYGRVNPSANDRRFLRQIGQKKSLVISYITGEEKEFGSNSYNDL